MKKGKVSTPLKLKVKEIVESLGYELVGVIIANENGRSILRVYIDTLGGILVKDCEVVSKGINAFLEGENGLEPKDRYYLEVSSPGIERPLFSIEDFRRFTGKKVKIKMNSSQQGQKKFTGKISSIDTDDEIIIETDSGDRVQLMFERITSAKLVWDENEKK